MTTASQSPDSLAVVTRVQAALRAPGMPFEVEPTPRGPRYLRAPRTLRELLESTRAHGDRPFLVAESGSYTFAEHYAAAAGLAHRYRETYGLQRGDRVVIAMRNLPEWQVAFWACHLAGVIAVPLNAWWEAEELAYALDDCTPGLVVADAERAGRMTPWLAAHGTPLLTVGVPSHHDRFEDLPAPGPAAPEPAIDPEDDATVLYTSGTTGHPKGVVATHAAWCAAASNPRYFAATSVLCAGGELGRIRPQTALMTFPFFHVAAFTTMFALMANGGSAVLMRKWDAAEALRLIDRHRVTMYVGVPATALGLLDAAEAGAAPLPTLTMISTGGSAAPPELARRITRRFGGRVEARNGYGLTETCGGVIANVGARYLEHPDSIGRPCPALELRIAGPDGLALPEGEVGELWLRGQPLFRGYRNNPEATAAAFADGWFRTGDLARVRDGEVYIVDRLKDMVIRGGENVYCVEVEGVLFDHPEVADAAVLGVPHPVLGEEVAAVVVLQPGATVDPDGLRAHVAARLAAFKVPAHLLLRTAQLPRNPTGKILKRALREEVVTLLPPG
ncbi:class I adenylate-forming enzyme family protein [Kitasatospora atroaurantiaca]|uniref:Acyl-CoA synthetase (AMP-forming)/AMP-acid ligase II n=1 Tax=Kitasatospora atroaurantiaca TaxID=285545 RepID=A0A561ER80_9ACTN|nr:class I adenylate-forming enzyme family protein [Kitasatospora atroaurantiaca]TWE18117.1 acyl-CoA synthetase (AMP-forming)/AMP-acid ligase II [Kitasatospora atroaurantiaca]